MIKKNVPYKVLKYLWVALFFLLILNTVGVWVGWKGQDNTGKVVFGIISGILVLADLIAMSTVSFLNMKAEIHSHGFAYGLLAIIHLIFVILTFTIENNGDNALPALWTVFLVVIAVVAAYFALRGKHPLSAFSKKSGNESSIRREDLGVNPDDAKVDEVANPENNPDRKPGRDEKTGIVSL